jgi:phosphoribosylformylglycinamidine synthase
MDPGGRFSRTGRPGLSFSKGDWVLAGATQIDQDRCIEIEPRWPLAPPSATDLRSLGIDLAGCSRILRLNTGGAELHRGHLAVLHDPRTERVHMDAVLGSAAVDVLCHPGVTDAEGEMAAQALAISGSPDVQCRAGLRYRFRRPVPSHLRETVERLIGNPLIHRFEWLDEDRRTGSPPGSVAAPAPWPVEHVWLDAGDDALEDISRRLSLALDLAEMRVVAAYFRGLGRPPTDVELQSIALTWSEHCCHKTFKATIDLDRDGVRSTIHGLLAEYLAAPTASLRRPWVRSALAGNAGVIAFDGGHDLAFKVETHNHPSALEPYGGAHTGVGGVIRDVLAMSAEPVANTDVLCFGPADLAETDLPAGAFHPRRTFREVVRGIADYGNNMGIPTAGGAVLFGAGYSANPLVFCGTLGLSPRGSHPDKLQPGDLVVLLGGRTGRDGLHGATMSSESLDRASTESSTVQIGAPITEKLLRDVLPRLRDECLYHAITDCGAGGLCSAVGEMGEAIGVEVDLALVPLKYAGLRPWEIWLSEAQERMVLAASPAALARLRQICAEHDLEMSVIGRFGVQMSDVRGIPLGISDSGEPRLRLTFGDEVVADLAMGFLHGGRPQRRLAARWTTPSVPAHRAGPLDGAGGWLLRLLAHPNIASKEDVIRRYDHEVGGATVVKPLVGNAGPSDAAVLKPLPDSWRGAVLAHGINPLYGETDPQAMALLAVDEALRNLVAVGGSIDRAALLDNFCWGDVDDEQELGALVLAAQGCRDAVLAYRVPFISGKDSLRNTSVDGHGKHSIPRTLLISALGVVPDSRRCVTMDLKGAGHRLYLLGITADELGGSHYLAMRDTAGGTVPKVRPVESRRVMRALTRAIRRGLVAACHDLCEGGLAVAAAEMALAGERGLDLRLDAVPATTDAAEALLFAESAGRFLVEVPEEHAEEFERLLASLPCAVLGHTTADDRFVMRHRDEILIDLPVDSLDRAWKRPIDTETRCSSSLRLRYRSVQDGTVHGDTLGDGHPSYVGLGPGETVHGRYRRSLSGHRCRAMVLTAAGINCDRETIEACRLAGADVEAVHLNQLLSGRRALADFGFLVIPGGFSYGDHLGAGAMLATILRHRFLGELHAFVDSGRPVLGICNGFQVLTRLGLLGDVSLVPNASGRFECRWVPLAVDPAPCLFLRDLETIELPIAHGEGRVVVSEDRLDEVLARAPLRYLQNPNGSMAGIAGVCTEAGTVFGLMPHPERYLTPYHRPRRSPMSQFGTAWNRRAGGSPAAGLAIFSNAVRWVQEEL